MTNSSPHRRYTGGCHCGYSVNARCLDGVDAAKLPVDPFNGREWEASVDGLRAQGNQETR